MKHKLFIILISSFLFLHSLSAQYYDTGQDPASLKWMQIKTGRFTVIYPEKYSAGGLKYAKSLDEAYSKLTTLFPGKKFDIPVIIHNYTIMSNGYVAWAPRRMELYPTPEQNNIPLSPEKQLATHELAHVLQMGSLNQGFSKGMSFLFGEQFTGLVSSLLPMWFLEGDAVFAESALTESGRGRTPSFQKTLKALVVDKNKNYSFDKYLNGSFRDYVPDDYQTGFQMVAWSLSRKDPQIWNKVLKFTADEPFTINPVNISLSRNAGLKKKTLWKETLDTLKTIWSKDISETIPAEYEIINPEKHGNYVNYHSPVFAGKDSIIAIRTSLSSPPSFVLLNGATKSGTRIHTPGQIYPWVLSYAKGRIVWVETQPDPRWANREYSVVKLMNVKKRTVRRLSQRTRYLAAAISPDGNRIAAVENSVTNINDLVIIDTETGTVIQTVKPPDNIYLQHPQWSSDGRKITFISLSEEGEGIVSYSLEFGKWETLIHAGRNDLQSSFLRNDSLIYVSSSSGTDNIWIRTPDKRDILLTKSKFGVEDITPAGKNIIFSNYSSTGNNICRTSTDRTSGVANFTSSGSAFLINRFDIKPNPDTTLNSKIYSPVPYRKWQHLFRFHSWLPFYADLQTIKSDPASIRPGVTIMTQNSLSSLTAILGYEYSADRRNLIHSSITWNGWYPVLESQLDYGTTPQISKMGQNVENPSVIQTGFSFLNTLYVPLQFSGGRFSQFLRPSVSADYLNQYIFIKERNTYDYGQTIITGRIYFSNYDRSSIRDIYPRWAQVVDFNYCFAPFDRDIYGSSTSLQTIFYLPGILPNNGIRIKLQAEKQDVSKYLYGNFSSLPRGYNEIVSKQIQFLSADYVFPLAYPDLNLSSILYIKRIRGGLFFDYATGPGNSMYKYSSNGLVPLYNNAETESLRSFGGSLLADFHLFRIPFMISGGVQSAWKSFNGSPTVEMLFNIDLFGLTIGKRRM
jgi:hypothetical protein